MTRRLRVLHVGKFYPPHPGGMESHLELLCRVTKAEVDLSVLVSADGRRTEREVRDGVPVTRIGTRFTASSASFNPGMAREIRRADADVVHFHHPNPPAVLSYLAARPRGRLVVTYHSDIVRQRVLGPLFTPALHRFLRRAKAIIASSPQYAENSPVLRAHADRVRVIPFGIDAAELAQADPAEVEEIRRRFGPRIVFAAGRLVYYKGFEYLVRAMRGVDGRLLIAGDGPLRGALERLAAELGLGDRVTLAGAVPDLRPYYHAADVFALPSVARSEAFGIVQMEAMGCGLAVVNTALDTGVPFVSPDGVTGITVPPADPDALADALTRLLDDPALRARLGAAGRARVAGELSAETMARRTLDVYRAAASASSESP
ncbi:MAG: glycosyltransferase [Gemmatimonadetes bacterium]|nr:glycosyltransferase [Gemmatimonadota bacterium]